MRPKSRALARHATRVVRGRLRPPVSSRSQGQYLANMTAVSARKTLGERLLRGAVLGAFGALLYVTMRVVPHAPGGLWVIAAIGFLLLAGTITSELLEYVGLPHITGYLLAGLVAGPHALDIVDAPTVETLAPVNTLALSLIALAGGAELDLGEVRKGIRNLGWALLAQFTFNLIGAAGTFLAMRRFIPFVQELPVGPLVGVAILWAVLATPRSPSATLGVLSQTRAAGPLASFTLAFVMTCDVFVIALVALAMGVARPLVDASASFSSTAFVALGHEIFGSVALGTTLGLVLAAYLRIVNRQMLLILLALGFGASMVIDYLQFDPLMTFMVAGIVVRNMSGQGKRLVASIEQTGSIVYVVFFATAGAHLDLPLLRVMWPVALALTGSRALVTWLASRAAGALAQGPAVLRRWSWAGLVSQAGLTLGLSVLIAREFPTFGDAFRSLAVATVALNEMAGPILFKLALDRSGETSRQPRPSFHSMRPPPLPQ
jgi:Kef-type K+ transport system membrane component KefB